MVFLLPRGAPAIHSPPRGLCDFCKNESGYVASLLSSHCTPQSTSLLRATGLYNRHLFLAPPLWPHFWRLWKLLSIIQIYWVSLCFCNSPSTLSFLCLCISWVLCTDLYPSGLCLSFSLQIKSPETFPYQLSFRSPMLIISCHIILFYFLQNICHYLTFVYSLSPPPLEIFM